MACNAHCLYATQHGSKIEMRDCGTKNMCIVHSCSNKFVDELFFIIHNFLLFANNCLFSNMYSAKTLTQHIGLKYKQIHC
jgi:hypothetical protein